jgi:hypothetical protein
MKYEYFEILRARDFSNGKVTDPFHSLFYHNHSSFLPSIIPITRNGRIRCHELRNRQTLVCL